MYDEKDTDSMNDLNRGEHKEEPITTNFTMRDPEPDSTEAGKTEASAGNSYGTGTVSDSSYGSNQGTGNSYTASQNTGSSYASGQNTAGGYGFSQGTGSSYGDSGNYRQPSYSSQDSSAYQGSGYSNSTGRQGIPHYQEQQYYRSYQPNHIPTEPDHKKKPGFFKKAAGLVGAALVFGIVAGSTMVAINWSAGAYNNRNQVEISQAETVPTAVAEGNDNTGSTSQNVAVVASSLDVSGIVDKAMPSVVAITSKVIYESQTWFGPMQREGLGSGSGIIVGKNDDELLIVTNNHVVEGASELKVAFIDQTAVDAAIKGTDADSDLAVIAVPLSSIPTDTASQIAIASLGNSDNLKVGQGVIAIGNALGYGQSVTVGYISALDRTINTEDGFSRDLLQTDAAINPGNSGGALLNMQGEVIGINSAKYSDTDVEGMGYAIPISKAQDIIDTLMTRKTRNQIPEENQGYLGIQCKNIDAATSQQLGMPQGVFIYKIVEGGAASKSDLREKDIITKFDGQSVRTYDDLTGMLKYYAGGSTVTITVQSLDNGQYVERNVDVTLDTRPVQNTQG